MMKLNMSFLIKDDKFFKKYDEIWEKVNLHTIKNINELKKS